jgi:hypothetical protein
MPLGTMLARISILFAGLFSAAIAPVRCQDLPQPAPPQTEAEKAALLDRVISNEKKEEADQYLYERIERREIRKNASDPKPEEVRISRVIPAGTGIDHIPLGPDGKPDDPAAYRAELEKLERALAWAAQDGHAQRDAYEKIAKRQKERDELIDATRTAFLYTYAASEAREGRVLFKYRMEPNPAFKPATRAASIFTKVQGFVWIDPVAGELARIEGEVTGNISIGVFLGKVYKGSRFMQERYEVSPGSWFASFSQYDFDGRKLFMSISVHYRTFYTQYRRVGPPKEALGIIRGELGMSATPSADP